MHIYRSHSVTVRASNLYSFCFGGPGFETTLIFSLSLSFFLSFSLSFSKAFLAEHWNFCQVRYSDVELEKAWKMWGTLVGKP